MPDIRTLLHDAAPAPAAPLRMEEIRARARRPSTRRLVAWIAGLGAVLGVGVPVGAGLLPSADEADPVLVIDPRPTIETTPTSQPAPVTVAAEEPDAVVAPPAVDRPQEATLEPSASTTPPAPAPSTTAGGQYPAGAACWVGSAGLDAGESRACRFTATTPGGWNTYSSSLTPPLDRMPIVRVTVRRGREVRVYRSRYIDENGETRYENCADDIIQPGDLVEVRIEQADVWIDGTGYDESGGAGGGWGCRSRGRP